MLIPVWIIGTNTTEHVWATNWPAALQTATAIRIRPQQQSNKIKRNPAIPNEVYPKALYSEVVPLESVGMFIHEFAVLFDVITPAFARKMIPASAKTSIIPIAESHTINPAKHLNVYMKISAIMIEAASAQRIHFQFWIWYYLHFVYRLWSSWNYFGKGNLKKLWGRWQKRLWGRLS